MTATNGWVAEDYARVNAPHLRTALAALALAGEAPGRGAAFAEIGCGTGDLARIAAERGFEVWASDASRSMVDATRERCAGLPVRVEVCPVERLELPEDHFAVVHSSWVLHWVSEVDGPLRRMARALRPGGHLVLQWTGAHPRGRGPGMFGILRRVASSPKWSELLGDARPAVREYPADEVAERLTAEGLDLVHYDPELAHPLSARGPGPTLADLPDLRERYQRAGFATQAAALGERADEFVDDVLTTMIEAGQVDPHHARIVARRPG